MPLPPPHPSMPHTRDGVGRYSRNDPPESLLRELAAPVQARSAARAHAKRSSHHQAMRRPRRRRALMPKSIAQRRLGPPRPRAPWPARSDGGGRWPPWSVPRQCAGGTGCRRRPAGGTPSRRASPALPARPKARAGYSCQIFAQAHPDRPPPTCRSPRGKMRRRLGCVHSRR